MTNHVQQNLIFDSYSIFKKFESFPGGWQIWSNQKRKIACKKKKSSQNIRQHDQIINELFDWGDMGLRSSCFGQNDVIIISFICTSIKNTLSLQPMFIASSVFLSGSSKGLFILFSKIPLILMLHKWLHLSPHLRTKNVPFIVFADSNLARGPF